MPLFNGTTDDIRIFDDGQEYTFREYEKKRNLKFEAHPNWKGHVERTEEKVLENEPAA